MIGIRIPIAIKLAVVFLILLILSMTIATYRTTELFKSTSGKREEDTNRTSAAAKASEVEILIESYVNRAKMVGLFLLSVKSDTKNESQGQKIIFENFYNDTNSLGLRLYKNVKGKYVEEYSLYNERLLKKEKSNVKFLKILEKKQPMPFARIFSGNISIKSKAQRNGLKVLSIGIPLVSDSAGKVSQAAVIDLKLAALQNLFAIRNEKTMYLIDNLGNVIAHKDEKQLYRSKTISNLPSVKKALSSTLSSGQMNYTNKKHESFIAAYVKAKNGLIILSEANQKIILEPAAQLTHEVMYITGMVLMGAIFFIFLFSLSLTKPIEKLVLATRAIAQGHFGFSVAAIVKSKDEVGTLALAFDSMLSGLAERDKVKGLLNKFHGSSVAEDMIANSADSKKGSRKPVVIFFSDIRNFTATSEKMEPEDVVSMLNEYFGIMVSIVIRNHGIVDKFIGDAIMAVWGAPQSTGDDTYHALKTCLQMREELDKLNERRVARNDPPIMIGMGLHSGEALSGAIGSDERMEYTVIGDTVNTAARVEASTKSFGTDLLITGEILKKIDTRFVTERCGAAEVKGKSVALEYFKVRGYIEEDGTQRLIKTPYSDYEAGNADKIKVVS